MKDLDSTTIASVQTLLDEALPDGRHWEVLELLAIVGCADALQLQKASNLSRDQFNLAVQRMSEAATGLPPIFFHPRDRIPRPGKRGAPPKVYCMGDTGAALLRARGYPHAHPCRLDEAVDITHAIAVFDVHLLARQANLPVLTEKRLPPGDAKPYLRPDNRVTLLDGKDALFEIEQILTAQRVTRAVTSLQNKLLFFRSAAGSTVSSAVRVLFNLPNGQEYARTLKVWEQALRVVTQRAGGQLHFRLFAMPLPDFIAAPDWGEPPQSHRWRELTGDRGDNQTGQDADTANSSGTQLARQTPRALRQRFTGQESVVILDALWGVFREGALIPRSNLQPPDPTLFDLAGIIYAAAHDAVLSPLARAGYPHAALYLFKQYLRLQPALCKMLRQEILRGARSIRWNSIAITHRMQVVSGKFLKFHGFADSGLLLVRALSANWNAAEPQHFQVRVNILDPEILMAGDGVVPTPDIVQDAEQALSWVLTALFAYADDLGLPRAPFW